ncbi:MAG: hypothetical protein ABI914_05495 [Acidobacteriota bacterium]
MAADTAAGPAVGRRGAGGTAAAAAVVGAGVVWVSTVLAARQSRFIQPETTISKIRRMAAPTATAT